MCVLFQGRNGQDLLREGRDGGKSQECLPGLWLELLGAEWGSHLLKLEVEWGAGQVVL